MGSRLFVTVERYFDDTALTLDDLTPRHQEIVPLVADGLSNSEIADRLSISVRTIAHHLTAIYEALGLPINIGRNSNRVLLARWYWEQGAQ